ncbi:MAG: MerR family transcriptional regulator [Bacteroidetes bacterium]|nr:MAG: MerR family transcriptional regulator [Bacteroidota bacterium]
METKFSQMAMEFVAAEEEKKRQENEVVLDNQPVMTIGNEEQAPIVDQEQPVATDQQLKKPFSKRGRPSLKEIDINADLVQIPPDDILFQKQYYSIGQVAKWFRVNQSLVRYWETEFDILQPRKNRKGDRFFRPIDVKNLLLIYDLLRRRKFTIEGAKDYLKNARRAEEKFEMIRSLEKIKGFFLELKATL